MESESVTSRDTRNGLDRRNFLAPPAKLMKFGKSEDTTMVSVDDNSSCGDVSELSDDSAVWGLRDMESLEEESCDSVISGNSTTFRTQPAGQEDFLRDIFKVIMEDIVQKAGDREGKVIEWMAPEELSAKMDLEPQPTSESHEQLMDRVKDVIKYSVKTGHPHFVNQLFSSLDPYGLAGQLVTDALNCSLYTYEVAPVFTVMEQAVLAKMRQLIGYEGGDGIFAPGGSIANIMALSCARQMAFPETKKRGLFGLPQLVLYTSELAHYSIRKAGCLLGFGDDNVRLVKTDAQGRMIPEDLEAQIEDTKQQGGRPFLVVATAGTTVFGAFDPINDIADVCVANGLWLHVDGAWGGGVLMSRRHRGLMEGVDRADSVTWNPHKLLGAPQQCSTFLTKHEGVLQAAHSAKASYLFQPDKFYDVSYDTGDKTFQCGRKVDVFKFWLMWKAKGTRGLEQHVNTLFDNTKYFVERLKVREGFQLVVSEPQLTNVCFWYIPPSLRKVPEGPEFRARLHKVAPLIKERMIRTGSMMITYQPQKEHVNFFRLVLQSSGTTFEDMDYFLDQIETLGRDIIV
ncbi:cysteine sulfinic acid decarboxylase-like [Haliotis rubra]|uniref:cysteine sulfinic acid decarboxylase-like n=1 Tax=Haliotis rubra TaxID=36100 RepID=UPI001EE5A571|nr:cysteine sulfinic acid decarboxylase-like [Haliotis rubra]